jgi:4-hydroxybenzoate polyprenyltransferase
MVKEIAKAIRLKNLVILVIIFLSIEFFFHYKVPLTEFNNLSLLAYLSIVFTAAAGYVINDLFDIKSDAINKKKNKTLLSINKLKILCIFLSFLSIITACLYYNKTFFILSISALIVLYLYSWKLKHLPLIGNLIIALLAGICPLIIYITHPEIEALISILNTYEVVQLVIPFFYGCMSFSTTLIREIIKDIEDVDGDKAVNAKTAPVIFGKKNAKYLALFLLLIVSTLILYTIVNYNNLQLNKVTLMGLITLIFIPLILVMKNTILSKEKKDFTKISHLLKFIFITSNFVLLIHTFS